MLFLLLVAEIANKVPVCQPKPEPTDFEITYKSATTADPKVEPIPELEKWGHRVNMKKSLNTVRLTCWMDVLTRQRVNNAKLDGNTD